MVYFADPPLYQLDYKPQEYVTSKRAYYDICENIYDKKWQHVIPDGLDWKVIKDSTLFRDAVQFNRSMQSLHVYQLHRNVLFEIALQTAKYLYDNGIDPAMDQKNFNRFIKTIKYHFTGDMREIYSEKREDYIAFSGVYDLKYMGLDLTYSTYTRMVPLINSIIKMQMWDKIYIRDKKSKEVLTSIAEDPLEVINRVMMYMPKIKDRMKGLGQTNEHILARTTLDPNTRTLIQLDLNEDFNSALEVVKSLRGSSMDDLRSRKQMIRSFDIDADDIDT